MILRCILIVCVTVISLAAITQTDSLNIVVNYRNNISTKVIKGLTKEYTSTQSNLEKTSGKILKKMRQSESRLGKQFFSESNDEKMFSEEHKKIYSEMQSVLNKPTDKFGRFPLEEYIPDIDSVQTTLAFLINQTALPAKKLEELQALNGGLKSLQVELQKAKDMQAFLNDRTSILNGRLMNNEYIKKVKQINKNIYYYQSHVAEYKSMLTDKQKLKSKLLTTVRAIPAFQKFWQKNSYFAQLFPMPGNIDSTELVAGLQTRKSVQNAVTKRVEMTETSNVTTQQYFQGQIDIAQAQLTQLKNKSTQFVNGDNGDIPMPDFKPNNQKTKSFLERLEYGINVQSEARRYSLPAMSDIALMLGYKLSDNKRIGIGASYKVGWGNIQHIHITSEGVGLRSYMDIKVPAIGKGKMFGGLWFSGGFEYNYLSSFRSMQELHDNIDTWQRSALVGMNKKYKVGKKEGNIQLLYDLLHNQQIPPGTALKFRLGYNF